MTDAIHQFLTRHRLLAELYKPAELIAAFHAEMGAGLAGKDSSLAMIPSFIALPSHAPRNEKVIVLDAGGTNFRTTLISFDAECNASIEYFTNHPMPGTQGQVSKEAFFNQIADYIQPVVGQSTRLGFCFSYPVTIGSDRDGTLLCWTKGVDAPEVVGEKILANLAQTLRERGMACPQTMVILNDTVATLLAGMTAMRFSSEHKYVGFIVGTGSNISYVEQNAAIIKEKEIAGSGHMAINVESANFNKIERGDIDVSFDQKTANPSQYVQEKMISGGYLGNLCHAILLAAVKEGVLPEAGRGAALVRELDALETKDLNLILENEQVAMAGFTGATQEEYQVIRTIVSEVVERAALLSATTMAAAVIKSAADSKDVTHCITVDGSVYYKLHSFKQRAERHLSEILKLYNLAYTTVQVDNAPVMGAAVASLAS
jgi:hexokinase